MESNRCRARRSSSATCGVRDFAKLLAHQQKQQQNNYRNLLPTFESSDCLTAIWWPPKNPSLSDKFEFPQKRTQRAACVFIYSP